MYYADYHSHSTCSPDGHYPMTDMAQAALSAGISELCLTDHCDLMNEEGALCPDYDWAPVLRQREALLGRFGKDLTLPMGLELGMSHIDPPAARRILSQPGLDFVIGSIHNFSPAAGGADFFFTSYPDAASCRRALDDYFDSMALLAPLDTYDVLGHIIYPLRYMNGRDGRTVTLDPYLDRLEAIFRVAARQGRGIELNTWTGRTLDAWLPLLRLFRACGGEIVTTGSDAHITAGVGKGIAQACDLLRTAGFRYFSVYQGRKPRFIRL